MNKEEILKSIFENVKYDLEDIGIPVSENIDPYIRISRAKRRWGSCKKINGGRYKFCISISDICFNEPEYIDFIKNTMAHEIIHTAKGCFDHGRLFKTYGKMAEKKGYIVNISDKSSVVKSEEELFDEARHVLKCSKCGKLYFRLRFPSKKGYINRIRCGVCGEKLDKIK